MKIIRTANFNSLFLNVDRNKLASDLLQWFNDAQSSIYQMSSTWLNNKDVPIDLIEASLDELQFDIDMRQKFPNINTPDSIKKLSGLQKLIKYELNSQKIRTQGYTRCAQCDEMKAYNEFGQNDLWCNDCKELNKLKERNKYRIRKERNELRTTKERFTRLHSKYINN